MRSGGGVLRMKHLIWPFSPCKACCVCVLEIVGGPGRKKIKGIRGVIFLVHHVTFIWHLQADFHADLLRIQAGTPVLGKLGLSLKTASRHHSTQTSEMRDRRPWMKPRGSSCIKELVSYGWLPSFPKDKYWWGAVGRVQDEKGGRRICATVEGMERNTENIDWLSNIKIIKPNIWHSSFTQIST